MARTKIQIEEDKKAIASLYKRGWSLRKIAAKLTIERPYSISYGTIKNDLDELIQDWREEANLDIGTAIAVELAKIAELEAEAWLEYIRSKKSIQTKKESRKAVVIDPELDFENKDKIVVQPDPEPEEGVFLLTDLSKNASVEINQTESIQEQIGDPRFLAIVERCIERRCKLLGLDKEDKTPPATVVVIKAPEVVPVERFLPGNHKKDVQTEDEPDENFSFD